MRSQFTIGDSFDETVETAECPAGDGWVLRCRFVARQAPPAPAEGSYLLDAHPMPDGRFRISAVPAITAQWHAGVYSWSVWGTRADERRTIEQGHITLLPDPAAVVPGHDARSQARRALDDAKAAFAAWSPTQRRYRIGEREMEFGSTAEILKTIRFWSDQVAAEERAAGLGSSVGRIVHTRL